jgi:hypothetical protein
MLAPEQSISMEEQTAHSLGHITLGVSRLFCSCEFVVFAKQSSIIASPIFTENPTSIVENPDAVRRTMRSADVVSKEWSVQPGDDETVQRCR